MILVLAFFIGFAGRTANASPQGKKTAAGIYLGIPWGVTAKHWLDKDNTIEAAAGFARKGFLIHGTYAWQNYRVFRDVEDLKLPLYYGFGPVAWLGDDDWPVHLGVRGIIGLSMEVPRSPVEISLELGVHIMLLGEFSGGPAIGLAARYYF